MSKEYVCRFCKEPVVPKPDVSWRLVKSWTFPRAQGGTNKLTLPEELYEYAHPICIKLELDKPQPISLPF